MARRRRKKSPISVGEVLVWVLFFALLVPAGFVGWAIASATGSGGTKTVTVTAAAPPSATTAAPATTAAAPTTTTKPKPAPAPPPKSAAGAGNAAAGKAVFASSGCAACHTFAPAGSTGTIGPDLDTTPTKDAQKTGMQLADFVRESIVKPDAYISPGYPKGVMPTTFATLPKTQLDDLVAFIVSGAK